MWAARDGPSQPLQAETILLMDLEGVLPHRSPSGGGGMLSMLLPMVQVSAEGAPAFTSFSAALFPARARRRLLPHPPYCRDKAAWDSLSPHRAPRWRRPAARGPCHSGSEGCSPGTPPALSEASRARQQLAQRSTRPERGSNQALTRPSHSAVQGLSQGHPVAQTTVPIPLPNSRPLTTHWIFFWRMQMK